MEMVRVDEAEEGSASCYRRTDVKNAHSIEML